MKLTKSQFKRFIKEEIEDLINERNPSTSYPSPMPAAVIPQRSFELENWMHPEHSGVSVPARDEISWDAQYERDVADLMASGVSQKAAEKKATKFWADPAKRADWYSGFEARYSPQLDLDEVDLSKEKRGDHMYLEYDPDPLVAMKMVLDELVQQFTNPKLGEGKRTLDAVAAWKSLDKVYSQMRREKRAEQGILPKPLP
jgi:hypothetical protein